jgi:hypothetical protein
MAAAAAFERAAEAFAKAASDYRARGQQAEANACDRTAQGCTTDAAVAGGLAAEPSAVPAGQRTTPDDTVGTLRSGAEDAKVPNRE